MKNIINFITEKIQVLQDRIVTKPLWQVALGLFLFLISVYLFIFSFVCGFLSILNTLAASFYVLTHLKFEVLSFNIFKALANTGLVALKLPLEGELDYFEKMADLMFLFQIKLNLDAAVLILSFNLLFLMYALFLRQRTWEINLFDISLLPFLYFYWGLLDDVFRFSDTQNLPHLVSFYGKLLWVLLLAELIIYLIILFLICKDSGWNFGTKLFLYLFFFGNSILFLGNTLGILNSDIIEILYKNHTEDFVFSWILSTYGLSSLLVFCSGEHDYTKERCFWEKNLKDFNCSLAKGSNKFRGSPGAHPEVKTAINCYKGLTNSGCWFFIESYNECVKQAREEFRKANTANKK